MFGYLKPTLIVAVLVGAQGTPTYSCDVAKNGNAYDCTWTTNNSDNTIRAEVGVFVVKGNSRTKVRTRFSKKAGSIEVSRFPNYET